MSNCCPSVGGVLALQQVLNSKSQDSTKSLAALELPLDMTWHSQHLAGSSTNGAVVHIQGGRGLSSFPCIHVYCCHASSNANAM